MTSGSNEVEHGMNSVVPETRVTLDTRLLGKDVIVLTLEVSDNLGKATYPMLARQVWYFSNAGAYLASLSIWSPKPGVSTMVREIRVPSSSNSSSGDRISNVFET